jgi:O-antigen ligase
MRFTEKFQNIFKMNEKNFPFGLLILIPFILLIQDKIWILVPISFLVILLILYDHDFILVFVIVSFLTLTSTISPILRLTVQIFSVLLLIGSFLSLNYRNKVQFMPVPGAVVYLVLALLLIMGISVIFSSFKTDGINQILRSVVFLLIIFLIYNLIRSEKEIKLILYSLLFAGVIYSFFLGYELIKNDFQFILLSQQQVSYLGGEYLNKNYLGSFFSVLLLILISFSFKGDQKKKIILVVISILVIGLLLTNSRAALLSFLVSIGVLLFIFNRKWLLIIISIIGIIILILVLSPLIDYFMIYLRLDNLVSGRNYLTESAFKVIENHFFFGAGPAATRHEMYQHLPYMLNSPEEMFIRRNFNMGELGQSHSFYLFFFSDLGIFGFILSILIPVLYFMLLNQIIKKNQYSRTEDQYYLMKGLLAAGIFIFTRGIFEPAGIFSFGNLNQDLTFWLLMCIICFYYVRIPADE